MKDYVYCNKNNSRKYIELRRYADGHYVWRQRVGNNYTGCSLSRASVGTWHRVNKQTFVEVLADYMLEEVI